MKKYVVILFLFTFLLTTGCSVKKVEEVTDAEKFAIEYNISKENPFIYLEDEDMLEFMKEGTGIIYFGFPLDTKSQEVISLLYKVAKKQNVKKIYYYNPKKIKEQNSKTYQELLKILETQEDNELSKFLLPEIYVLESGKIVSHNHTLGKVEGNIQEYLTKAKKRDLEKELVELVKIYQK